MGYLDVNVDINKLVEQIKQYAGPVAQHGWEILVKQQYIQGIQQLIWAVALFILVIVSYRLGWRLWKWAGTVELDYTNDGIQWIPCVIAWIISAILVITSIALLSDGVAHLLNPEYYAVQQIYCSAPGIHC